MTTLPLKDSFGRHIDYLRLSVTDRCDLRCTYCMAEEMQFLPKREVLSLEELEILSGAFIDRGVKKIRVTGGEPLTRRDIMTLMARLGRRLEKGDFEELTLTTNATQLYHHADVLKSVGVKRINVSLDTLDDKKFTQLTRRNVLSKVLQGLDAAQNAGLKVKINTVALKGFNDHEIPEMISWAHGRQMDLTLIEVMPLGAIDEDRVDQYLPLSAVRDILETQWTLDPMEKRTGGPARYVRVRETGGTLGFITPLTNNFCAGCNRVRVTCTGQIYMCLGHSDKIDLRAALRGENPIDELNSALDQAMIKKPERHNFEISKRGADPSVPRHMSVTGG
ncbi:GTP 3',8-cyclase MoaA [Hyphococcus sp. DH-69]|uniref:GTP 3',8-cyclase MoaA n=1 Tax=Hyphococcus formosus TaxID=3143534 RepID=UPI00398AA0BA